MRRSSEKTTVGILGGYGSFHHQAANDFFPRGGVRIAAYETFLELFIALETGQVTYAVAAVENSIAGSIAVNYTLMARAAVRIIRELWLPVKQNLITLPGTDHALITEIHAHPMCVLQCRDFLEPMIRNGVRIVETSNTALSVKYIYDMQAVHMAAIGSMTAASLYRLDIAAENIQTGTANYTRFLLLSVEGQEKPGNNDVPNKATLCCTAHNSQAAIPDFAALSGSSACRVTNIIPLPVQDDTLPRQFIVDITYPRDEVLQNLIGQAAAQQYGIGLLGTYRHMQQSAARTDQSITLKQPVL